MKEGAFAILDCLGFKGVWARPEIKIDPTVLPAFFEEVLKSVEKLVTRVIVDQLLNGKGEFRATIISDTIVISASPSDEAPLNLVQQGYLINAVASAAAELAIRFLNGPTPLLLRGCITYGSFIVRGNFFVGPAVDEAASFAEVAQGAFIWLTPAAGARYAACIEHQRKYFTEQMRGISPSELDRIAVLGLNVYDSFRAQNPSIVKVDYPWNKLEPDIRLKFFARLMLIMFEDWGAEGLLKPWAVPLSAGGFVEAFVLNSLALIPLSQQATVASKALATFDLSKLDVLQKQQHTRRFLLACNKQLEKDFAVMNQKVEKIRNAAIELGIEETLFPRAGVQLTRTPLDS